MFERAHEPIPLGGAASRKADLEIADSGAGELAEVRAGFDLFTHWRSAKPRRGRSCQRDGSAPCIVARAEIGACQAIERGRYRLRPRLARAPKRLVDGLLDCLCSELRPGCTQCVVVDVHEMLRHTRAVYTRTGCVYTTRSPRPTPSSASGPPTAKKAGHSSSPGLNQAV